MVDPQGLWKLEQFPELLQLWRSSDPLPGELMDAIERWYSTREVNPRRGARRLSPEDNLWVAEVPNVHFLDEGRGWQRVMCDYRILEEDHKVVCVEFGTVTDGRYVE